MHDIRLIRNDPEAFDAAMARRGMGAQAGAILALDTARRAVGTTLQEGLARRNEASKAIGAAMGQGRKDEAEALKRLLTRYEKRMALADACVVRMSELARECRVFTLDRTDFSVYRRNGRDVIPLIAPDR